MAVRFEIEGEIWFLQFEERFVSDYKDVLASSGSTDVGPELLVEWYRTFAERRGGEVAWRVLCRRYGVHRFGDVGVPPVPPRPGVIAKELGVTLTVAEGHIKVGPESFARALETRNWNRAGAGAGAVVVGSGSGVRGTQELRASDGDGSGLQAEAGESIDPERYGFGDLRNTREIEFVTRRIVELRSYFESAVTAVTAQELVRTELMLAVINIALTNEREKIADKPERGLKEMNALEGERQSALKSYETYRKALGLDKAAAAMDSAAQVRADFSWIVEAAAEYMAEGPNAIFDGMHSVAEVKVLMTEFVQRGSPWRPDVARVAWVAGQDEVLWDFDWNGLKVTKKEAGAFSRWMPKFLAAMRAEEHLEMIDLESGLAADDDEATAVAEALAGSLGAGGIAVGGASSGSTEVRDVNFEGSGSAFPQRESKPARSFYAG
jgi:hypothetical protein